MSYRTPMSYSTGGGGGVRTFLVGVVAGATIGGGAVYTLLQRSVEDAKRAGDGNVPTVGAERGDIGRALHSFTSQLNLSAFYVIGGAPRGCVARVKGVLGGV
jgi:hypothetical protein